MQRIVLMLILVFSSSSYAGQGECDRAEKVLFDIGDTFEALRVRRSFYRPWIGILRGFLRSQVKNQDTLDVRVFSSDFKEVLEWVHQEIGYFLEDPPFGTWHHKKTQPDDVIKYLKTLGADIEFLLQDKRITIRDLFRVADQFMYGASAHLFRKEPKLSTRKSKLLVWVNKGILSPIFLPIPTPSRPTLFEANILRAAPIHHLHLLSTRTGYIDKVTQPYHLLISEFNNLKDNRLSDNMSLGAKPETYLSFEFLNQFLRRIEFEIFREKELDKVSPTEAMAVRLLYHYLHRNQKYSSLDLPYFKKVFDGLISQERVVTINRVLTYNHFPSRYVLGSEKIDRAFDLLGNILNTYLE